MNYCHVITIYMNYCHVVMYTYHKTYEVEAKVHASLLLDTLNFLLVTIFIDVLWISTKVNLICFVNKSTGKLCIVQAII